MQINGKAKGTVKIAKNAAQEEAIAAAKADEKVGSFLQGKTVVKEIYVPGRIINLVVR